MDFRDSVDSNTINVVSLDEVLNPVNKVVTNEGVVLIEISKTSESTMLNVVHVLVTEISIRDNAVRVIVIRRVERNVLRVVLISVTHMVSNNIDHNPDVSLVASINKGSETTFTTEVTVDFSHVLSSITVESIRIIIGNRGDPNSVETQICNIVEVVFDTLEVTTAIVGLSVQVATRLRSITKSESISDDLIDVTSLPFLSSFGRDCNEEKCSN